MAEFYTVITNAGREAVARATQAGEKVEITHFAVGDGGGVPVTPNESQIQLVGECWRGLVSTYKQEGTSLIIDTYIPADEESFTAREMGIFTADGVLFAVSNIPDMRKVLPSEGAVGDFAFGMKIDVSNLDTSYIEIHTNPQLDFIKNSEKGQPNGVATLDENGNVEQLPPLNYDPAGSAAAVQGNLNAHAVNRQNPHGVTAVQIGAISLNDKATLQEVQAGVIDNKWISPYTLKQSLSFSSPDYIYLTGATASFTDRYDMVFNTNFLVLKEYVELLLLIELTPTYSSTEQGSCNIYFNNIHASMSFSSFAYNQPVTFEYPFILGSYDQNYTSAYQRYTQSLRYYLNGVDRNQYFTFITNNYNQNYNMNIGYIENPNSSTDIMLNINWKLYGRKKRV